MPRSTIIFQRHYSLTCASCPSSWQTESAEETLMEEQPATVLALGMTPSEFVKEIDPDTWYLYDSGIRHFIEACDGVFSAVGATAAQQKYQRQFITARRKLAASGI